MSIHRANLRRILQVFALDDRGLTACLRKDIGAYLRTEAGGRSSGGGDFYVPFWSDAKSHALRDIDLSDAVVERIAANPYRRRLYPVLEDGFLRWWNMVVRDTNEPISAAEHHLGVHFAVEDIDTIVKVENFLSFQLGSGEIRHVYPYFSESPLLTPEIAGLGLWLLSRALPNVQPSEIVILDVMRGRPFSIIENPPHGREERNFIDHYRRILARWDQLFAEYNQPRP